MRLTLITSVLNARSFIDAMLASVPDDHRIEHLVIDAGSTDGTLDRLHGNPKLRLLVRPGIPLYAAWNEAVREASAPYILFLNADDRLPHGAVDGIIDALNTGEDIDVLSGEADAFITSEAGVERVIWQYRGEVLTRRCPTVLIFGAALINAKVFRRDLIREMGGFDVSYPFASDREFLLRLICYRTDLIWRELAKPLYRYRIHPRSKTLQQSAARRVEISQEHQRIADQFTTDFGSDPDLSKLLRAWRTHETAVFAIRSLEACQFDLALAAAMRLMRGVPSSVRQFATAWKYRLSYRAALRTAANNGRHRSLGPAP